MAVSSSEANGGAARAPVVGILHPGDLGAATGSALAEGGVRVLCTSEGRSAETLARAERARLEVRPTLVEVVQASDLVISLVLPSAAHELATRVARISASLPTPPIFVEGNSIDPGQVRRIGAELQQCGVSCVDATVHGTASRLTEMSTVFVSGSRAEEVADALAPLGRVRVVGTQLGAASEIKMLLSGFAKGLVCLGFELLIAAQRLENLDETSEALRAHYPESIAAIDRMAPSYPRHATRRATEMACAARYLADEGSRAPMVAAAAETINEIAARSHFDGGAPSSVLELARIWEDRGVLGIEDEGGDVGISASDIG